MISRNDLLVTAAILAGSGLGYWFFIKSPVSKPDPKAAVVAHADSVRREEMQQKELARTNITRMFRQLKEASTGLVEAHALRDSIIKEAAKGKLLLSEYPSDPVDHIVDRKTAFTLLAAISNARANGDSSFADSLEALVPIPRERLARITDSIRAEERKSAAKALSAELKKSRPAASQAQSARQIPVSKARAEAKAAPTKGGACYPVGSCPP